METNSNVTTINTKKRRRFIFNDPRLRKQMFKLFVPFLLQELVVILTTLMSNLVLKWWQCDPDVIKAIASAFQLFFLYNITAASICYVANLFISQHYGRGAIDDVQRDYYVVMKLAMMLGVIFFILVLAIPQKLLFFTEGKINEYGAQYLRWFSPVFLLIAPSMINYTLMKNMHLEKFCTVSSIITFTLVLTFETAAIFSLPPSHYSWALELAASSMVVARLGEFFFLFLVINKKSVVKFKIKDFFKKWDSERFKSILYYGSPVILAKISWGAGFMFITIFTSMNLTSDIMTAHSLIINYQNIVMCVSNAISSVIAILIGRELGANRIQKAKDHASDMSRLLLLMGIIETGLVMLFFPIAVATTSATTLDETGGLLWVVFLIQALIFIPRSYNAAYINGILNVGGDTLFILAIDGVITWITIVPLAFLGLNLHWNPVVIYALIQLEEVIKCPIAIIRYKQKKWAYNITKKKGIVFNE